jgi:hypothetical protein
MSGFRHCGLVSISIPESVEFIGDFCFSDCYKLAKVEISQKSKLREIGKSAFSQSRLRHIALPVSVEFIGSEAVPGEVSISGSVDDDNVVNLEGWIGYHRRDKKLPFDKRLLLAT